MEELFDRKYGELVPKFDLIGKDVPKLLEYINIFDKATEDMINGSEDNYNYFFCFEQLEDFASYYPGFLCDSLPKKEGKILTAFFSKDIKESKKNKRI